jgi:tRNA A37 methylthiotransferase MiaB
LLKGRSYDNGLRKSRKKIMLSGATYEGKLRDFTRWAKEMILQQVLAGGQERLDLFKPSVGIVKDYPGYRALRFYVEVARGCSNFQRTSIHLPHGRKCIECQKCRSGEMAERVVCPVNIPPGCGFCSVPSLFGCSRSRTEDAIVREVKGLIGAGVRRLILSASDFLDYQRGGFAPAHPLTDPCYPPANIDRIESLLSKVVSIQQTLGIPEKDYVYLAVENVKPCLFNDDVAAIIANYLPESTIHIGCETGSEEHSLRLGRPSTPAQTLGAVSAAVRHGLRPYVYFIHGLPGQTAQTARETVAMMRRMVNAGAEKITLYKFKPLPFSAFEMFPQALPARKNDESNMIERVARELNVALKNNLLGKTVDVIALEYASKVESNGIISYPVKDGPVVILSEKNIKQGTRLKVKITEVLSDRLVKGESA